MAPPLDPSADEARRQLARELAHPSYWLHRDWISTFIQWLWQSLRGGGSGGHWQQLGTIATIIVIAIGVLVLLRWFFQASRQESRTGRRASGSSLVDAGIDAGQYRAMAEQALAAGDCDTALAHAFRSMVVDLNDRGVLGDIPARTSHEVAVLVGAAIPQLGAETSQAASWFDVAVYGLARPPRTSPQQAAAVLDLGRRLHAVRPAEPAAAGPAHTPGARS